MPESILPSQPESKRLEKELLLHVWDNIVL
jgi:hypothetical protein